MSTSSCQLCLSPMEVLSVGECNHPVCHVCTTRMRVLCQRRDCALCRTNLSKVVFTRNFSKFSELENNIYPIDRKYQICFETEEIQADYTDLLSHQCHVCEGRKIFQTFAELERHMRRDHQRHFCQLCQRHLHLFSSERELYTRSDLARHRRKDHPECTFCKSRFFDSDQLFTHCKREHFICHICEKTGVQNIFADYSALRKHFGKDHHLCRDPKCEEQKFVVFQNEIDLKAHQVTEHGATNKTARNLNLNFGRGGIVRETAQISEKLPDLQNDFPKLKGSASGPVFTMTTWATRRNNPQTLNGEDFPTLT